MLDFLKNVDTLTDFRLKCFKIMTSNYVPNLKLVDNFAFLDTPGGPAQCVELELRWQFCVHGSTCPEIYF